MAERLGFLLKSRYRTQGVSGQARTGVFAGKPAGPPRILGRPERTKNAIVSDIATLVDSVKLPPNLWFGMLAWWAVVEGKRNLSKWFGLVGAVERLKIPEATEATGRLAPPKRFGGKRIDRSRRKLRRLGLRFRARGAAGLQVPRGRAGGGGRWWRLFLAASPGGCGSTFFGVCAPKAGFLLGFPSKTHRHGHSEKKKERPRCGLAVDITTSAWQKYPKGLFWPRNQRNSVQTVLAAKNTSGGGEAPSSRRARAPLERKEKSRGSPLECFGRCPGCGPDANFWSSWFFSSFFLCFFFWG